MEKNCIKNFNWRIFHADCIDVLKSISFEESYIKRKNKKSTDVWGTIKWTIIRSMGVAAAMMDIEELKILKKWKDLSNPKRERNI